MRCVLCVFVYTSMWIYRYTNLFIHIAVLCRHSPLHRLEMISVLCWEFEDSVQKKKTHNWMKHFLCCVEQASEVLLVLVLSAIIQCSGLISKLLLDKLVSCQDEGLEFSWQRSGKVHEELRCWMVQTEPVGWVCQSFVIWMKWQLMSKQNSDLVCVCITAH